MKEMPAANPIIFDKSKCMGCNRCMEICQVDIFLPNPEKGKPPIVAYPGECWYCGCCVMECPVEGAIELQHPLMNRVHWIEKRLLIEQGNE
ncbi:MAG: 4Fe-4S binding protein [Clostridiales bacterium]|jgi:NAD-dependent dihydropyrimidine dehydrogenase PreA subunit|nr:4Fe-4S binding protein [Clostridiales bacterium]